jgi:hypothetical protein
MYVSGGGGRDSRSTHWVTVRELQVATPQGSKDGGKGGWGLEEAHGRVESGDHGR